MLPDIKDIVTMLVALYGATLATVTFVAQRREKSARLQVSCDLGFEFSSKGASETLLMLKAANVGHVPVTLSSYGLALPGDKSMMMPMFPQSVQFPYELTAGKSCTVHLPIKSVARGLSENGYGGRVKLVPKFSDQTGKVHIGKSLQADVEAWLKET